MHRFYLSREEWQGNRLTLTGSEAHHALHVLRVACDEEVTVLDGAGQQVLAAVREMTRASVQLEVLRRTQSPPPSCEITLLQAIPKGRIIEDIIQKATELGVHRIVPLLSEHVVMRLDSEGVAAKAEKWQQVAIEAVKQCGQVWLPKVESPRTFKDYLSTGERFELALIGALHGGAQPPRTCFDQFRRQHSRLPQTVALWIGPEGDFTPGEIAAAKEAGARPITMGDLILRVETAAIYGLSLIRYESLG